VIRCRISILIAPVNSVISVQLIKSDKEVFGIKHVSCDSKNSCAFCKAVTVRIDDSPGWGGFRASGIDDMLNKLEETHPNGGIRALIISNHGGLEGSFPMGNGDDLNHISSTQVDRLKKLLSSNAIIDIRMCYSSGDKDGNEAAQKLANKIGVRILGYEGPVSPYGTRPGFIKIDKDRPGNYFQHIFPDNKPKIFYPEE